MPPPPSDAELLASFTPREHEFHAWNTANRELLKTVAWDYAGECRILREAFHDPKLVEEYNAWHDKWFGRHSARSWYQMTPADFFNMLRSTNFMSRDSLASFRYKMEMYNLPPLLLLGESQFGLDNTSTGYALLPGNRALWPHLDMLPDDPTLLPQNILGINLKIHIDHEPGPDFSDMSSGHRRRHQERSSGEDTVRSTDSDDIQGHGGFVFVQIGVLYTFSSAGGWEEKRTKGLEAIMPGPWLTTGFAVVVEIDVYGRLGGVWAIFNFHTDDEDEHEDEDEDEDEDASEEEDLDDYKPVQIPLTDESGNPLQHIGRLTDGSNKTFTVAKIANSVNDLELGHTRKFEFDVWSDKECQIVRAKVYDAGQGRWLLRQFVKNQL
ncbi:Fc.00g031990.m01.CDS01 [Cosmosporella sp. VM-42]